MLVPLQIQSGTNDGNDFLKDTWCGRHTRTVPSEILSGIQRFTLLSHRENGTPHRSARGIPRCDNGQAIELFHKSFS